MNPKTPERTPLAFGYGRVSTNRQQTSVEVQEEQTRKYYDYRIAPTGAAWGGWYCDTATSGKTSLREREAGGVMFSRLRRGDHVIVSKYDRCFRSLIDGLKTIEEWQAIGVVIHFLDIGIDTTGPLGKIVVALFGMFAEFERERIRLRIRESCAKMREQGRAFGNTPIGFKKTRGKDGKKYLAPCVEELLVMRQVWLMRNNGEDLMGIRRKLIDHNITLRGFGAWGRLNTISMLAKRYQKLLDEGKLPDAAKPSGSTCGPTGATTPSTVTPPPP